MGTMSRDSERSWFITIGNVTELVANQKKEISNVVEKSGSRMTYIFHRC